MIGHDSKLILSDEEAENFMLTWNESILKKMYEIYLFHLQTQKMLDNRFMGYDIGNSLDEGYPINYQLVSTPDSNVKKWVIESVEEK